jgi:class 3 adenylate cyclase/tetratricopeptide (TPR) repeat protein
MERIADWLNKLSMSVYAERFAENDIDLDVLGELTDQDFDWLGVAVGHRRRMLSAIQNRGGAAAEAAQIAAASPAPLESAERRQLTVMFCDLAGSTASATLDPEDLRAIIETFHRCGTELIERSGGFVAKYMGDGLLAYFGYPQTQEHDAERAVRTGLALTEAVPKLATNPGPPLQVRIGIATGLVVVGDLIGARASLEQAVVGATLNLAAALRALADPGAVVIASSTRRLTGGLFEYRDLGTVPISSFGENLPAFQVVGANNAEGRFEALHSAATPLVGRDEEIDLLTRRWEQAKRGDGCVVLVQGEPGIGKSRLAQSILEQLSHEPHTRLRYFCSPLHQESALYPNIAQLERAAGFGRQDTDEERLAKLEGVLARVTNDLQVAAPLFAALLSIPTVGRYPTLQLSPQKHKEKTLHALLAQMDGLAARQPLLIVWEDLQWSDPTARELLDLVVDRVVSLSVLLIVTYRPEFTSPWVGRPHMTLLTLNRLPRRRSAEMIIHVTGGKALPKEIADQIVDRTDGVPLFVEELTKSVVESGLVTDAGDRFTVTGPVPWLKIPTTLHGSLLSRLDHLAGTREVAQIGAALGKQFSHELISAVAGMPQQHLDDALAHLARADLIIRRGTAPDVEYTFKHALVQDTAYSTLLRSRRQQLHGRIATTLESRFPEIVTAHPELVAQHYAEAGMPDKSVGYLLKAGQQAIARSAMTEAVAQLQQGLSLLASLPDSPWHRRQELELLLALGRALFAAKGWAARAVGETYARAGILAEQLDRSDCLIPLLCGRWAFHLVRSELRLALSLTERIERIGKAQDDVALRLLGHLGHGVTRFHLGEFAAARALLEQCHGLNDPAHRAVCAAVMAEDPHARMLAYLAWTLTYLGYIDQGRSRINDALTEARRLRHAYPLGLLLALAAVIESATGSPHEAKQRAEETVALANEHGFPLHLALGNVHLGGALTALGQAPKGLTLITDGLAMYRATGAVLHTPWMLIRVAEGHVRLGQPIEGLECFAEAAQVIETTDERREEAELHRVRGDLLNATGDRAAAEQCYHQALAVARRQSAKLFELRAATSLARLWRDQGKRHEARDLLAPVYGWFTEGFDTPVLKDAKASLDQLA